MNKLLFRSCEAADGRTFAFLTDQPEVEEAFDNGYKVAYKDMDGTNNSELLASWKKEMTVESQPFTMVPEANEIPQELMDNFNSMMSVLIKGVDVLFCDYNLGVEGDLPMCNELMDQHKSTDFVLFSCADIVGDDPSVQPYMVSYASPRYETGAKIAQQHRIYCKTDNFAFCQAINAIVVQRKKDNLMGGHIRSELTPYIGEPTTDEATAQQELSRFVDTVRRLNGDTKALEAPQATE
jgi:hypothetical protein